MSVAEHSFGGILSPLPDPRGEGEADMLQHQRIFELSQLASLADGHKEDRILDWSLARESDIVVFLTERSSDVFAVSLNDSKDDRRHVQPSGRDAEIEEGDLSIRSLKWYEDPDLRPICLSFSPDEEYAVVATVGGSLFIVPVQLLVPNHHTPGSDKGKDRGQNAVLEAASYIIDHFCTR